MAVQIVNGTEYCNEFDPQIYAKIGTSQLETQADNLSDAVNELNQSLSNLTLSKSVSGTTDANSNLNLNLSSNDYVVKSVYLSNRIAIPFIYNNNWYCSVRQTDSSMSPVANASVNGYVYYEKK